MHAHKDDRVVIHKHMIHAQQVLTGEELVQTFTDDSPNDLPPSSCGLADSGREMASDLETDKLSSERWPGVGLPSSLSSV